MSPWAMALVALAIRLIVMPFTLPLQLDPARDHFGFGFEMGRVARSIAAGQGFSSPYPEPTGPTSLVAPAYPYILSGIFKLFGVYSTGSAIVSLALNNLFSALTCVPLFFIAKKIFGAGAPIWAGWIWAFFPYAIGLANRWIWDTSLTTFLFTLIVCVTLFLGESSDFAYWLGYGLLWGLTGLLNPSVLSTLPFVLGWLWFRRRRSLRNRVRPILISAVTCLACISIWVVRDFRTFGKLIPLRSNFALEFQLGNSEDTSHPDSDHLLPPDNPVEMEKFRKTSEMAYMAEKQKEVELFLRRQPGRFLWLTSRRILFLWTGVWGAHPGWSVDDELGIPNILVYSVLSLLAFRGSYRSFRNYVPSAGLLAIILLVFPFPYYITHPDVRYRHPIDPEIVLLAAYGAVPLSVSKRRALYNVSGEALV